MDEQSNISKLVEALDLSPHPEGGFFKEVYRNDEEVRRKDGTVRSAGTAIYFLLPSGICTEWHRQASDEQWHFYEGDKLMLEVVDPKGSFRQLPLCSKLSADCSYQQIVPKNSWQRAYTTGTYSLVGCTVSPGFEFDEFEMIKPQQLADRHPEIAAQIKSNPFSD